MSNISEVADTCIGWANANLEMTWAQYPAGGDSTLYQYVYESTPLPPLNNTILACWELPLLALVRSGQIDGPGLKSRLKNDPLATNISFLITTGFFADIKSYQPGMALEKGYLAFFDGMQHVALLSGERNAGNNAVVVSFWAHTFPQHPGHNAGNPVPGTPVEFNTIEGLQDLMVARGLATIRPPVQIAKPFW